MTDDPRTAYTITTRENFRGGLYDVKPIPDPFVNTTVVVRGWRTALRVLFRRYSVSVLVHGDRDRMEQVLELNPDYLGPPGSRSREAWNAELNDKLRAALTEETT